MKDTILEYASLHENFSAESISKDCGCSIVTARQYLSALFKEGKLERVRQGLYSVRQKQTFIYRPSEEAKEIYQALNDELPFADFCMYDGSIISPIQHHLSINKAVYVETNRDVVETVFGRLKAARKDVYRQPDARFVYDYIDLKSPCVIVKTLVTESPTSKVDGIVVPTLEKMLVDIQADPDFDYLRGSESQNMYDIAFDLYSVNTQRMLRYARRRNMEEKIKELIDTAKEYDK